MEPHCVWMVAWSGVCSEPTATDLLLYGKTPEQIAHLSKIAPLERLGQLEDVSPWSPSWLVLMPRGSMARPCG